jgi:inner membrane protein
VFESLRAPLYSSRPFRPLMVRCETVPSVFSHAVFATSIGTAYAPSKEPLRILAWGAVCSVIPDFDVLGFSVGIQYSDLLGHRGLTHSLVFAALLATITSSIYRRSSSAQLPGWVAWSYLFLATASHGVLDAMTDGGLGVAFLAPFNATRYFLPWRPVPVSPIGAAFFSARGLRVLQSELIWIWIPSAVVVLVMLILRHRREPASLS